MNKGETAACILREETADPAIESVTLPHEAEEYAAALYAALHDLDGKGVGNIVVEMPPQGDVWGAVRDRLLRAGAPR